MVLRRADRMAERMGMVASVGGMELNESLQDAPLQGTGMNECGAFAGTETALWDGLGFDEGAEFVVGGGG